MLDLVELHKKSKWFNIMSMFLSDFGFRQNLEVRTLGCTRKSHLLPTHISSPRKDLNYMKNNTRDTRFILLRATIVV